jgi:hypothetical protein
VTLPIYIAGGFSQAQLQSSSVFTQLAANTLTLRSVHVSAAAAAAAAAMTTRYCEEAIRLTTDC